MFNIILIVIAVFVYLIYKGQKPKIMMTKEEEREQTQLEVERKERYLEEKIKKSILKNYMQKETLLLEYGKKNFLRLTERFKHDDVKFGQIVRDWMDYLETLSDVIFHREMLDVCTSEESDEHYNARDLLFIKIQETHKRFKELLGNEYMDPEKQLNPQKV